MPQDVALAVLRDGLAEVVSHAEEGDRRLFGVIPLHRDAAHQEETPAVKHVLAQLREGAREVVEREMLLAHLDQFNACGFD